MIGIIDYGMGNLRSVQNTLNYLDIENMFIRSLEDFNSCEKYILPGVGAFGQGIENLKSRGFVEEINKNCVESDKPILGICLGMQLLFESSEEHGHHKGLGLIKGDVTYLGDKVKDLSLPHMGWNDITIENETQILKDLDDLNFYFVHNFYCSASDKDAVTGTVEYGIKIDVVVESGNIMGCQFHPEKSHQNGLQVLRNYGGL